MPRNSPSILSSGISSPDGTATPALEKAAPQVHALGSFDKLQEDPAFDRPESLARPVAHASALFVGLAVCLAMYLIFVVYLGQLITECLLDHSWTRLALVVPVPLLMCVSLFFFQVVFTNLFQIFGPIGGVDTNSRFYSCHKPCLRRAYAEGFMPPKITIQMPVYKEGMESVIVPTVRSLQAAVSYYESHGGSANIFINDDGLRAGLSEHEVQKRRDFYHDNNIGWVSRPKHNGEEAFVRKGKFKKASNMNFALNASQQVEAHLQEAIDAKLASGASDLMNESEEAALYEAALSRVLEENPLVWAEGDIRVGEIILLVDSDTRVVRSLLFPVPWSPTTTKRVLIRRSQSTASCMVLPRCSCPPKPASSNIRPVSCRSRATTLKTASPSSPTWSTPRSASRLARARWPPLSATMLSSAGRVRHLSFSSDPWT